MYAVLQLLQLLSNLSKNIATEALKKLKRTCLMASLSVFSVPQWRKKIYHANGLHHSIHFKSVQYSFGWILDGWCYIYPLKQVLYY